MNRSLYVCISWLFSGIRAVVGCLVVGHFTSVKHMLEDRLRNVLREVQLYSTHLHSQQMPLIVDESTEVDNRSCLAAQTVDSWPYTRSP